MVRAARVLSACLSLLAATGAGPMAAAGRQIAPAAAQQVSQQPPQPTFRAGVTIVPVDVRVLDRDGKPITDLKQSDFTVLEDSAPQEIRYFSARGLVPVPEETKPAVRTRSSAPLQEQSARIFLIVLGRGRLQYPSRGVDALIHFVRNRLLPQDQVAVLAFNRSTNFTTDRARILQVLERYKQQHEDVEATCKHQTSGLAGVYGSLEPSTDLQRDIDAIVRGPQGQSARTVTPVPLPEREQAAAATRRAIDDVARAEILAGREKQTLGDTFDLMAGELIGCPSMRSSRPVCRRCTTWAICTRASSICGIWRARSTSSSSPNRVSTPRGWRPTRAWPHARTTRES